MGVKEKSSRTSTTGFLCVIVVSVLATATALEEDVSGTFILSRARRSPQWQYSKAGASAGGGRSGDASSGGNVRFLNLFNTDSNYDRDRPYYNRPGSYGGGGSSGSGSNFGLSLHYGQQNHQHRPNYGGGNYYDPHYDYHHGYHDHHHHHHPPPRPYGPPPRPYGPPPYHHYPPPGGFHGGYPPGYYHGRSSKSSASASSTKD